MYIMIHLVERCVASITGGLATILGSQERKESVLKTILSIRAESMGDNKSSKNYSHD